MSLRFYSMLKIPAEYDGDTMSVKFKDNSCQLVRKRGRPKQTWKRTVVEEVENVVRHGARLKGWRRTESDGGALQMPYVPNRTKGHKCKM
jgi:hypothetical protein